MNRRIAGVTAALAIAAGLAAVSTMAAGVAVADDGRSGQQSDSRERSSEDTSIFTVNNGINSNDSREFGREFSTRDQVAQDSRDQ